MVTHTKNGILLILLLILTTVFLPSSFGGKRWYVKENCEYVENPSNDGDSFHVRVNRKRHIYRLYWVDTPESDDGFADRVAEQAAYFGITEKETIRIGKEATKFTAKFLEDGFTAYTKYQNALGMSRKPRDYVMIETDEGDLGVELVRNGLARIHGVEAAYDEYVRETTMRMRLKTAEAEAKKEQRGAWAFSQAPEGPSIEKQTLTIQKSVRVLSPENPSIQMGMLKRGATIDVTGLYSPTLVIIQIETSNGKVEGLVQRAELGI